MTDRELLEFIAAQVGALTTDVGALTTDVGTLKTDVGTLKTDVGTLKTDVGTLKTDIGTLKNEVGTLTKDVSELKEGQNKIESELGSVKRITLGMEQSHGKQLTALFDGYKQNADKLDIIEKEVSKHEEVILRRVK